MKKLTCCLLVALIVAINQSPAQQSGSPDYLRRHFITPPDSVKPSIYWYWMSDNVSAEGVKKDLEAMRAVGIGRAFIGNIGYPAAEVPYGQTKLFSDDWWKAMDTGLTIIPIRARSLHKKTPW